MTEAPRGPTATAEPMLACPRDARPLVPFVIGGVTVDTCHACTGVWLDAGEMRRVTHDEELERLATTAAARAAPTIMCPRCGGQCLATDVEGVALDTCGDCRGVWLDRNELRDARTRVMVRQARDAADAREKRSPLRRFIDAL